MTAADDDGDAPQFSYRVTRDGDVFVAHRGRDVTTLRGQAASRFLRRIQRMDEAGAQGEMARVTGNFKRGNERRASPDDGPAG